MPPLSAMIIQPMRLNDDSPQKLPQLLGSKNQKVPTTPKEVGTNVKPRPLMWCDVKDF